jgi:hypothetical protein
MCKHFVPAITHKKKKEAIPIDQQRLICCGMIFFFAISFVSPQTFLSLGAVD